MFLLNNKNFTFFLLIILNLLLRFKKIKKIRNIKKIYINIQKAKIKNTIFDLLKKLLIYRKYIEKKLKNTKKFIKDYLNKSILLIK